MLTGDRLPEPVAVGGVPGPAGTARPAVPDDNDDSQRHTITAIGHRSLTVTEHRPRDTVGYASEGWEFESFRLRPAQSPLAIREGAVATDSACTDHPAPS
jgi:hypothetical protein